MKLYNSLGPNPHTVRMFALEKGIDLPLRAVDVMGGEHRRPPYSVFNPMMQTPAFEADDGQVIVELTAIFRATSPNARFIALVSIASPSGVDVPCAFT